MSDRAEQSMKSNEQQARIEELESALAAMREEWDRLQRERDLALAHDTQPYPTAWAYEQVCATLDKARAEIAHLTEARDGVRQALQFVLDNSGDPVMERVARNALASPEGMNNEKHEDVSTRVDNQGADRDDSVPHRGTGR